MVTVEPQEPEEIDLEDMKIKVQHLREYGWKRMARDIERLILEIERLRTHLRPPE